MKFKISITDGFKKAYKRLAKKYPSLKKEIELLGFSLGKDPKQGDFLGKNTYKIRLAIASKSSGKSGGARVITVVFSLQKQVVFADIYDKSDKENITDEMIKIVRERAVERLNRKGD